MSESSEQPPAEEPRSPEEIRAEIEATRAELGDTVEALAAKTDVKAQAAQRVGAAKETLRESKDDLVGKVGQATPETAAAGVQQLGATVQEKPVPFVAVGAFAAGALLGWLLRRR
ncbi:MAG TPA: DUF3618 domain-containing protein [Solirubrobacteraceae bacterium]|jgi:ElaB/YqjD/DUF883 family membrane-anchored ribosome-binding protein